MPQLIFHAKCRQKQLHKTNHFSRIRFPRAQISSSPWWHGCKCRQTWLQKPFFQSLFLLGFAKPWDCHLCSQSSSKQKPLLWAGKKCWQQKSSVQKQMLNFGSPVLIFHSINKQASRLEQRFPSYNTQLEIPSHSTKQIGKMHLTRLQQQNCCSPNSQPAFQIQALLGTSLEEAELQILKQIGIQRERERHTHTHMPTPTRSTLHSQSQQILQPCMHACMCVCVCVCVCVYQRFGVQQSCGEITIWEFTIFSSNEHSHADCCSNRVVYTQVSQGGGGDPIPP